MERVVLFALTATFLCASCSLSNRSDLFQQLVGTWGWVERQGSKNLSTCESNPHTISFSETKDRMYIIFSHSLPQSTEPYTVEYRVFSSDEKMVRLEKTSEAGNALAEQEAWDLIMVNTNLYVWRRPEWPPEGHTPPIERCNLTTYSS